MKEYTKKWFSFFGSNSIKLYTSGNCTTFTLANCNIFVPCVCGLFFISFTILLGWELALGRRITWHPARTWVNTVWSGPWRLLINISTCDWDTFVIRTSGIVGCSSEGVSRHCGFGSNEFTRLSPHGGEGKRQSFLYSFEHSFFNWWLWNSKKKGIVVLVCFIYSKESW